MTTYLYPQNLKATANLWLWSLRDFAIMSIALLLSILILAQTRIIVPLAVTLCFGFLSIRLEDTTILDFIRYAVKYFISTQQIYFWAERGKYKKNKQKKTKQKGKSVQDLLGIKTFTKNGLKVGKEEFIFYMVQPTNISVLSHANIEIKVRHLMMVLSAVPDIEITCTDSCECFDTNKSYIKGRIEAEQNEKVRKILNKDLDFLDSIQTETSTARQFLFIARCKSSKSENVLQKANRVEKIISDQGFEVTRMKKADIKRFLAIYFEASMNGDLMPDYDGEQYISEVENEKEN